MRRNWWKSLELHSIKGKFMCVKYFRRWNLKWFWNDISSRRRQNFISWQVRKSNTQAAAVQTKQKWTIVLFGSFFSLKGVELDNRFFTPPPLSLLMHTMAVQCWQFQPAYKKFLGKQYEEKVRLYEKQHRFWWCTCLINGFNHESFSNDQPQLINWIEQQWHCDLIWMVLFEYSYMNV